MVFVQSPLFRCRKGGMGQRMSVHVGQKNEICRFFGKKSAEWAEIF